MIDPDHAKIDRGRQGADPEHTLTVAGSYVRALLEWAERCGLDSARLLHDAGLDSEIVNRPGARVPFGAWSLLFQLGEQYSGDSDFGLHVGEHIKPGHYNILGYLTMSCDSLAEAIERLLRFEALVGTVARSRLVAGEDHTVRLQWRCPIQPWPPRHVTETTLAAWVSYGRWITGNPKGPQAVHFQHPAPPRTREHRRLFDCPVRFSQPVTELILSRDQLALPLSQSDPGLRELMDREARRAMDSEGSSPFIQEVRHAIAARLGTGSPDLSAIAAHFGLSPRSLQRRLADAGTGFNQIVDRTRHELAHEYLRNTDLTLGDIAFVLGFSEQSAFTRAFRRWTGQSPGHYRGEQLRR